MKEASALYRLLGDEARLRLLRVLDKDRFNVKELTGILGLAQSGVSRHLGLLKESELVVEERDGAYSFYRLAPAVKADGSSPLWPLLQSQFDAAAGSAIVKADESRLQEVLRLRRENFEHVGPDTRDGRQLVPGRSWAAWSRALGMLLPPLEVADLGCGEGYLTVETARWAKQVTAVDRSAGVLTRAKALAERKKLSNITWKKGELEKLPIDTNTMDVALLSQALHHASEPPKALDEALRILKPGGRLLILDLRPHDETWVREKLGDRWFGFSDEHLSGLLTRAGFTDVRVTLGARRTNDPFAVLLAIGTKRTSASARKKSGELRRDGSPAASRRDH
ncbi:MAG: metalloregulator ArsR/SmtB family transcription factor [Cyanobacteria bacterium]|nr:metalloregulator ArsR/SmtB family transcription factor [Cyanobacteriota bacterium]